MIGIGGPGSMGRAATRSPPAFDPSVAFHRTAHRLRVPSAALFADPRCRFLSVQ